MNFKKIILGITISLVMISCSSKETNTAAAPAPSYPVIAVQKTDARLETVYPVTIKGQEDVEIRPRIDGWIDQIYVDEGSEVKARQLMFKINSPQAQQAYTTAKAAMNSAQALVNTAKLDVDRIKPLADKGIVSTTQLSTYENVYQTALASLAQAQAGLTNAQATLGWTNVSAPVAGIVGEIQFRKGSLVNSANALTTVANINKVYAYFTMNEKEFMALINDTEGETQSQKIKNLPEVELVLADKSVYQHKGRIETISGSISVGTGTVNFRVEFPNPQGILRSGLSGRIHIPKLISDVFVIPQEATFSMQDKIVTYKVQGDTIAIQQLIDVLEMPDGKHYAVTSGLNIGERIVSNNVATLTPNMKITPVTE